MKMQPAFNIFTRVFKKTIGERRSNKLIIRVKQYYAHVVLIFSCAIVVYIIILWLEEYSTSNTCDLQKI